MMLKRPKQGPLIVTIDIETAPLEAHTWGTWKQNVANNQIITEWSILSFSAKALHSDKLIYKDNRDANNPRDDHDLLAELADVLDAADILVVQNGIRFDMRKIRARMAMLGMRPFSPVKVVDTMVEAKKLFAFTSNRLEWLSAHLTDTPKDEHKEFPGFSLWVECLKGNPRAWRAMQKYNKRDIVATEEVYLQLRPWIEGHPNVAQFYDDELRRCTRCGSTELEEAGVQYTQVGKYTRYTCGTCGGFSRDRYTAHTLKKRRALLTS